MRDSDKIPEEEVPVTTAAASVMEQLAAPFDEGEIKFKPAVVSGGRALALPYVDARVIQDRLDEALGVMNWQDEYECLPEGSVVCKLRLRIGDEWITKMDVGGPSEQPDEGDRRKAAFSDALKRAAVKFGVGRYLYRQESQWVDYDPAKKKFVKPPRLPSGAGPRKPNKPTLRAVPAPTPAPTPPATSPASKGHLPASGEELQRRLYAYDARLASDGLCKAGDLVKHVVAAGVKAGHDRDLASWAGPAIALAVEETKAFETQCRQKKPPRKEVA
jgi:hypothetical protein